MPFHLVPPGLSRRRFIVSALSSLGALRSSFLGNQLNAASPSLSVRSGEGRERWALLSDTHIAQDPKLMARGINMADHLIQAVGEVLEWNAKSPLAGLFVNGDCAYSDGQAGDYGTFAQLLRPVLEGRIPVHLTMGNHDHRERLREGLGWSAGSESGAARVSSWGAGAQPAKVDGKLVSLVRAREVDWFLLDSLVLTNQTPGTLGSMQVEWLNQALAASPERPALVMVHHNPQKLAAPGGKLTGLTDTDLLLRVLAEHRRVKALFFGHTHVFNLEQSEGLHLVNLPACAYRFGASQPTGWVAFEADSKGASLVLYDAEQKHAKHGLRIELEWRGA